jgi:DNA polymerase-4
MRWLRQILFGDVDAMYVSAAVVADPSLAGRLLAVGGPPPRGIITSASYLARARGIRAAMPTVHALRLCPDLVVIPPDRALYQRLHEQMHKVTNRLFPATEWMSIDEFYVDTTALQSLYPDPIYLGRTVKDRIFEATGLRCTIGIAASKTVAKIAADQHKPDGLAVIQPGTEPAFLAPLPVQTLPGIGPKTTARLKPYGIRLVGDLLESQFEPALRRLFGSRLAVLQALARGIDHEPVVPERDRKSLGHETTFDEDTADMNEMDRLLRDFLSGLTHELRLQGLAAGAFTVKLKDAGFKITTRSRRFPGPLNADGPMWPHIQFALHGLVRPRMRYRLIGLSLSDLVPVQEGLFDQRATKAIRTMDAIIEKHGAGVMRLGGLPEKTE